MGKGYHTTHRMENFVLKGHICYSLDANNIAVREDAYLVCEAGRCAGVFDELSQRYASFPLTDYADRLIIPGMTDLHIHAPQFPNRALGMDCELMQWLDTYTFPCESRFADLAYAKEVYSDFAQSIRRSATTRLCAFATIHQPATQLLMDALEETGVISYVGKVNMDRNAPESLCETTEQSVRATQQWLAACEGRYMRTKPILTPRFIPSCSNELLAQLGEIARQQHLPVQSHLSENLGEIAFVHQLMPEAATYGEAYDRFELFGSNAPCVMAHCVHSSDEELDLIRRRGVFIAHSPESNMNLASGIAPVSRYLAMGLNVGLATDVAGGSSECMFRAIAHAIQASKLRWRLTDQSVQPLTFAQAFYLATRGGGAFFGKVGTFQPDFEFDALVIDDADLGAAGHMPRERLERLPYLATWRNIVAKFVAGSSIQLP